MVIRASVGRVSTRPAWLIAIDCGSDGSCIHTPGPCTVCLGGALQQCAPGGARVEAQAFVTGKGLEMSDHELSMACRSPSATRKVWYSYRDIAWHSVFSSRSDAPTDQTVFSSLVHQLEVVDLEEPILIIIGQLMKGCFGTRLAWPEERGRGTKDS